ncbi:glycoside hydrolase family 3 protein [Lacticaseibacillus hulanensis]|uniref:glycoside hydrolase family 3 protein n=1 Tax=Lacticaseibacillus hulanensis TaxID=2493111 RepID=UPI001F4E4412|nr:glycoside hydrolase family 3 N-terminal domain-containing protein [Lacticaseibacillus hulanensis]
MMKKSRFYKLGTMALTLTLCGVLLAACGGSKSNSKGASSTTKTRSSKQEKKRAKPVNAADEQIDSIMKHMSLQEKVGQLFLARVPATNAVMDVQTYHFGGYLLFGLDMAGMTQTTLKSKIQTFQQNSKIPLLIGSDEEGGTVSRLSSNQLVSPVFRSPHNVYASGGMKAVEQDATVKAQKLKDFGIQLPMAPVADVVTNPAAFIYDRTVGLDAQGTSTFVKTTVTALQNNGVAATLKHFPGYGNNADSHVGIVTDTSSMKDLKQTNFKPFAAGIKAGADSVLVSHNIVNAIDKKHPASVSKKVHKVLRKQLHFRGVILTDDLDMAGLADFVDQKDAALVALQAGNDMVMTSHYDTQIPRIMAAVKAGDYSKKQLNASVKRVLRMKQKLGMLSSF